jgi:subtilisin family serine protease
MDAGTGKPGKPGNDVGARRSRRDLRADAAVVRRQVAALHPDTSADFQRRITALVRRRRAKGAELEQFDLLPSGGRDLPVLRGALLVRPSLEQDDPRLLAALSRTLPHRELRLDERLLVLSGDGVGPEHLLALYQRVRRTGHEAGLAHLVPLGVVVKGEGGPEPTLDDLQEVAPPAPATEGVRVAVVDTGVPVPGRGHRWHEPLASPDNADALDAFPVPHGDGMLDFAAGHGAFVVGVLQQVAPEAVLSVYSAVDSDGVGSELRVAEQLLRAVRAGAEIVNLSLGVETVDDEMPLALTVAFELMAEEGHDDVLLVAAAGNDGGVVRTWPAAHERVVAVAGLTARLEPTDWSTRGDWVDVSTVGEGVVSTYVRGRESVLLDPRPDTWPDDDDQPWAVWTGTSFASPQVAGEVARRLALARAGGATASPRDALEALLAEGSPLPEHGVAVRLLAGTVV